MKMRSDKDDVLEMPMQAVALNGVQMPPALNKIVIDDTDNSGGLGQAPSRARETRLADWCLAARRLRQEVFSAELMMGPAWEIMLDLYILAARNERAKITSLSSMTGLPSSTAGRWARRLIGEGLVECRKDTGDRRRSYLSLSRHGRHMMEDYFSRLALREIR